MRQERVEALIATSGRQDGPAFRAELNGVVEADQLAFVVAALAQEVFRLRDGVGAIASQATALVEVRS